MEQLKVRMEELEAKTGAELSRLCAERSLSAGTAKEERVQRLLRDARETGEIDRAIFLATRAARRSELEAMDKAALGKLCAEIGVDPLVKPVLVERLLNHEAECA